MENLAVVEMIHMGSDGVLLILYQHFKFILGGFLCALEGNVDWACNVGMQ